MPQQAKDNHEKDYDHISHLEIGRVGFGALESDIEAFGHRAGVPFVSMGAGFRRQI